jgi:RNA polymerase sigma-70 factor (ECF subfamily)
LAQAPLLRRVALSLCGTIDRAEDLVQDTFLQAVTHLDSFRPGTNLAAWLVTILRNPPTAAWRNLASPGAVP